MFINIQLYKHEPVKGGTVATTIGRVSLDAFETASDDDIEARLRLASDEDSDDGHSAPGPKKAQKGFE